jgi:tRNA-specific 2-thiouridylase
MKIALGMSGGIDSTMCALLLLDQGHEVIGVTMKKWSPKSGILDADKRGCFGPSEPAALDSAVKAAQRLGIEHHIIDLEDEFKHCVLDYYSASYLKGETPNPCVVCNRSIKFGDLPAKTRALGIDFDYFATGHYARLQYDPAQKRFKLLKALDPRKDQSYFLSMLSQDQLAQVLFPLGNMLKEDIKQFAAKTGYDYLVRKKESQDFLESNDNSPLFENYDVLPGDFVDTRGKVLGRHKGLIHYTIGQRKGLGLAGFARAQYVVGMDRQQNRVIISSEEDLYKDSLIAYDLNWLSIGEPEASLRCAARIRLAQDPAPCVVEKLEDSSYRVKFDLPVSAITPGQVVAFYRDDVVLGAGYIK